MTNRLLSHCQETCVCQVCHLDQAGKTGSSRKQQIIHLRLHPEDAEVVFKSRNQKHYGLYYIMEVVRSERPCFFFISVESCTTEWWSFLNLIIRHIIAPVKQGKIDMFIWPFCFHHSRVDKTTTQTWLLQSHLTWEWTPIVPIPKGKMLVAVSVLFIQCKRGMWIL